MNSPFRTMIDDAQRIQVSVREDTLQIGLAMEQLASMRQACKMAKDAYDSAEAEFVFDLTMIDPAYLAAKNADAREVVKDRALVKARQGGALAYPWRTLCECQTALDNAQLAYDQAESRFKAIRVCAELQSAMLLALAADSRLMHA